MWIEPAQLTLDAHGTPFSSLYADVYHSAAGGPAQARHVFLGGNDLPARWRGRERFVILETGFGLGLNFLATWAAWQADPDRCQRLHFVSVEKHPFSADDLETAHAAWPEFAPLAAALRRRWPPCVPGFHRLYLAEGRILLSLLFGDAFRTLKKLNASVDAFYLDGFSPAKNPELWSPPLCRALARLAAPGATLATWSVASAVQAALSAVEFDLEKRPGFADKRSMLQGRYRSRKPPSHRLPDDRRAIVIGAGAAGSLTAHRLAARGWQVEVLESRAAPGEGASGNLAGMLRPLPSLDDNPLARLTRAGYLATRALLEDLGEVVPWQPCGVLHLARDAAHEAHQRRVVETLVPPRDFLQFLDRAQAGERLGWPTETGGWWFPGAGWVQPYALCRAALSAFPQAIRLRSGCAVERIETDGRIWRALGADGRLLAEAPQLIMACGAGLGRFPAFAALPQRSARGQVSHLPETAVPPLDVVACRHGYLIPAVGGWRVVGASFRLEDGEPGEHPADHAANLQRLQDLLPGFEPKLDPAALRGRVGFRPISPDRLPMVGPMPKPGTCEHRPIPQPGLWCVQGFGTRGIVWSALMGELLASRMDGDPLPLPADLVAAVDPGRWLAKRKSGK